MKKQTLYIMIAGLIAIMLTISIVSANQKVCITKGQNYPCPNPSKVCKTDYCYFCVNNAGCVTYDKNCPGDPVCGVDNGSNGSIDLTPPTLTIISPNDNQILNTRAVLFNLNTNEPSNIFYKDNNDDRGTWKRIAVNTASFNKLVSLKEGLNEITIKAEDMKGNEATVSKSFRVDSVKPKITKISPAKGFANGIFNVWFSEMNAKTLVLNYGNNIIGRKSANVDLNTCTDLGKGKFNCTTSLSLSEYNNQNIDYSYRLTDIADSYIDSKLGLLQVDTSLPVINNPTNMIKVVGKYVYFNLSITEANLDAVYYIDTGDNNPRLKKICSSLKDGYCLKKVRFIEGNHIVDIKVDDEAGNSYETQVEFNIVI